jgi:hypothetical protein
MVLDGHVLGVEEALVTTQELVVVEEDMVFNY